MLRIVLPLAAAVLVASQAAALTLLDDRRSLRAEEFSGSLGDCGSVAPDEPFQPWFVGHGCIHGGDDHDSIAEADELRGFDHLETTGGGFDVDVETLYEIDFEVATPTTVRVEFDLGMFMEGNFQNELSPETAAGVRLLRDGIAVYEYEATFSLVFGEYRPADPTSGHRALLLDPGATYTFSAWLRSYRQTNAVADFSYSLTEVPEPAPALLVALGTAVLAARRRSGRRDQA